MSSALVAADGPASRIRLRMSEWEVCEPSRSGTRTGLEGVTLGDDSAVAAQARALARAGVVTVTELLTGLRVETGSYVGRIALGPLELVVEPKVAWERWQPLLGYALRIDDLHRTDELTTSVRPSSLQDIFIIELVRETRALLSRGLHREYERQRRPLAVPRGRIDFARIARAGVQEARIPSRFTRRLDDTLLNQVVRGGLALAATLATDTRLRGDARQLEQEFAATVSRPGVTPSLVRDACRTLDRRTARYAPVLRLIELLVSGMAVVIQDDETTETISIRGFALDMNSLWQRLLERVLTEWVPGVELRSEATLTDVIRLDPEFSQHRRGRTPRPRPDFTIRVAGGSVAYLDAKYRDLWATSLPREMLYQLALYASVQAHGAATMLYPTDDRSAAEERLNIYSPTGGSVQSIVALRPVHLFELEQLVADVPSAARDARRARFAGRLLGTDCLAR